MQENPYSAPDADLVEHDDSAEPSCQLPRGVGIGRGVGWIGEAFDLFKMAPGTWIALFIVYMIIMMAVSILPIVSIISSFIQTLLGAGIMYACRELERDGEMEISYMFQGFREKTGPLLGVAGIVLLLMIVIFVIAFAIVGVEYLAMLDGGGDFSDEQAMLNFALAMLVALGLLIPVIMLIWFAPTLILLNGQGVIEAMKNSFMGCIKNILPMLLYSIVFSILFFIGMIPLFLGLLVVMPVAMASYYTSYKDIYIYED